MSNHCECQCRYAQDVGMESVGKCPTGKCVYSIQDLFVLLIGHNDSFGGIFVSEQKAFDYAASQEYDVYSVGPASLM